MSRIGNQPVQITDGTQVTLGDTTMHVKGAHGEITIPVPHEIKIKQVDNTLIFERVNDIKETKALHGLLRCLGQNAVMGVQKPWEKKLEVIGTGYRVKLQGKDLLFEVGFSHPVNFPSVDGIQYMVQGQVITVSGADKQLVGEVANKIKSIRKPDPYKGKGIRYEGEHIKLKPGKKAKTA